MASVYDLKPRFQALLRPLCGRLVRAGVTANHVTLVALLLSVGAGTVITMASATPRLLNVLPVVLFVRMALNAIDGMIAREHDMTSNVGAVLNELGDVVSDTALYLPLALVTGFDPVLVTLIVIAAVVTEMTGVLIAQLGGSRRYDGPMGKSDRALVFGVIGLLLGCGLASGLWLVIVQWGILALLVMTVGRRARRGLRELRDDRQDHEKPVGRENAAMTVVRDAEAEAA